MDENNKEGGLTDEFVNYVGMWTQTKHRLGIPDDTTWVVVDVAISNLST